jgi:hypothetical protein
MPEPVDSRLQDLLVEFEKQDHEQRVLTVQRHALRESIECTRRRNFDLEASINVWPWGSPIASRHADAVCDRGWPLADPAIRHLREQGPAVRTANGSSGIVLELEVAAQTSLS